MYYLVAFYFCNHLAEEKIAGCFPLIVFLLALLIVVSALCLFLTVSWIGLQCVIVTFPGHTYLFVEVHNTCCCFFSLSYFIIHYSFALVMIFCHFLVTCTETLCLYTIITPATLYYLVFRLL